MRVVELSVTNFRSVGDKQTIRFHSPYAVLVGANNAGKSNLLTALEWVLSRSPFQLRIHRHDFFDPEQPIEIVAKIGDVDAEGKKLLFAACSSKQQRGKLSKESDPVITLTLRVAPLEASEEPDGANEDGDAAAEAGKATMVLDLWGFPIRQKVAQRRAKIVQMLPISAGRRIKDDLSGSDWTPYGKLMRSVLAESPEYPAVEQLLTDLNAKITEVFATQKENLLQDAQVASYVDDIAFQLTKENNPVELLRNLEVLVTDGPRVLTLDRMGTGTQSAVIIALLELALRARGGPLSALAIEEPDSFIHPHGIRHLALLIKRIATEDRSQVILSTHSPALLATLLPGDIVRVARQDGRTLVFQSDGSLSDVDFTRRVNQDTAELLFSRRVVLVEGPTERLLLPAVAGILAKNDPTLDLSHAQTTVIEVGGKSGVLPYLRIVEAFGIEGRAILDSDFLAGPECPRLVSYLRDRGHAVDDSDEAQLRESLRDLGIAVWSKGEIEDHIPVADVSALTSKSEQDVRDVISAADKTSKAFVRLFGCGKPEYALTLAGRYEEQGSVPSALRQAVQWVVGSSR